MMDPDVWMKKLLTKHVKNVPVGFEVPQKMPEKFIRIERIGGNPRSEVLRDFAFLVETWAPSRGESLRLVEKVSDVVFSRAPGTVIDNLLCVDAYEGASPAMEADGLHPKTYRYRWVISLLLRKNVDSTV